MADAAKYFSAVLKRLRPSLKRKGFRAVGQSFVLESPECWAVINLQKSRWSEPDEKTFYVNVAFTAKRLLAFDDDPVDKPPVHWKCICDFRAEQLGPEPRICSWTVRDEESVAEALAYIRNLICEFVIPWLKTKMSEAALLDVFANDPGIGYPQLKAKSALLAAAGDLLGLRQSVEALRGSFGSGVVAGGVREHIEKLRLRFPDEMQQITS